MIMRNDAPQEKSSSGRAAYDRAAARARNPTLRFDLSYKKSKKGADRYVDPRVFVPHGWARAVANPTQLLVLSQIEYWFLHAAPRAKANGQVREAISVHDLECADPVAVEFVRPGDYQWRRKDRDDPSQLFIREKHHVKLRARYFVNDGEGGVRKAIYTTARAFGEELGLTAKQVRTALHALAAADRIDLGEHQTRLIIMLSPRLDEYSDEHRYMLDEQKAMKSPSGTLLFRRTTIACERNIVAALLFSQLNWMMSKHKRETVYKTDAQFADLFGFTPRQIEHARGYLVKRGFVTTATHWVGTRGNRYLAVHYAINRPFVHSIMWSE